MKIVLASIFVQIAGAKTQKILILYMQINRKDDNYMAEKIHTSPLQWNQILFSDIYFDVQNELFYGSTNIY